MSRDFRDLFAAFNAEGVRFLVVGAHAVAHHHKPRFTKDIDVWVDPSPENAEKVTRALLNFGASKTHVRSVNFSKPGEFLQIGVAPVRIDVLTQVEPLTFPEAWQNRADGVFMDQPTFILGLRDLIASKRAANRDQDRIDVKALEAKVHSPGKANSPTKRRK